MAVDVSKIPNNSKFDPVREAILNLQAQIGEEGQIAYDGILTINTSGNLSGSGTFTANQESNTTISIGITDTPTFTSITTDSLQFTGGTGTQGTLSWNADEETIDIIQNGATLQVGQEVQVHVKNQTGATIPDGTPVYVTGTLGASGRLTVAPMIADGSIEAKYFLGVTTEAIPNGEDGKVTTFGKIRGLDTTAYTEGTTLYVSATTAGAWQTTVPVAPELDLEVAIVINVHANNGTIFVRANQGLYLGMLHDVYLNSPADNQILVYNDTNNRWENSDDLNLNGNLVVAGDLTVSGTTTYINTNHLNIGDNIIQLNADIGGSTAPTEDAGFYVNRGNQPDASFLWDEDTDKFSTFTNALSTASLYIGENQVINSSRQFLGSSTISSTVPYFTFSGDSNTGVGRATNNKVSLIAEGVKALEASDTGVSITGDLEVGGTFTADGVTFPNDIITSADFSATDNRFKLTLTQADAGTIEASFDDVVLSESMAADYIPYIKVGGGDGDTTNAILNDSFLKINGSTLELDWVIDGSPGVYTEHDLKMRKDGGGFGKYYEATYAADSVSFLHYASASDIDTAKIGATTTGRIRINDTYSLPVGDGTSGQVLSTNGSGDLSWVAAGGPTTSDLQDVTDNGAITTNDVTVNKLILPSVHDKQKIGLYGPIGTGAEWIGTSSATLELSGANINLNGANGTGTPNLKMGGTIIIDASRNLTNIGAGAFGGNVTIGGYLDLTSTLYTRSNLEVLNAAGNGWNTWGARDAGTGYYNLTTQAITAGINNPNTQWGRVLIENNTNWAGGTTHFPNIGSTGGNTGSLIMIDNPHVNYRTDNTPSASFDFRAGLRMGKTANGTWWDAGMTSQGGDPYYHILNGDNNFEIFKAYSNGSVQATRNFWVQNANTTYTSPHVTAVPVLAAYNTSTASTAHAIVSLRTQGPSGGDPFVSFDAEGVIGWAIGQDTSDSNKFKLNGAWSSLDSNTKITVKTTGEVGIGTTNPTYNLDVAGSTRLQSNAQINGDLTVLGTTNGIHINSTGHASVRIDRGSTSYDNNVLFMTAGNLDFRLWQDGSSDYLYVRDETGGAGNMVTFKKGGNVGIGIDPAQKLSVDGAIRLTSNPSVTGDGGSMLMWNQAGVGPTIAGANFQVKTNGNTNALTINSSQYATFTGIVESGGLFVDGLKTLPNNQGAAQFNLPHTGYNAIRFYETVNGSPSTTRGTIHQFGTSWSGGASAGYLNIDGHAGVNFGAWNAPHAEITSSGVSSTGVVWWNSKAAALSYGTDFVTMETASKNIRLITSGVARMYINQGDIEIDSNVNIEGYKTEVSQFQISRDVNNAALWFQEGNLDTNHVLWNDYYGGPTTRGAAGSGFDGIKWNTYRGIHLRTGLGGAYNSLVIENSSGSTNDHVVKLFAANDQKFETRASSGDGVQIQRDLYISGSASGNYGNQLGVGVSNESFTYTHQDTNQRPIVYLNGKYPVLTLNHTVTTNTNHGPTIQFTHNGGNSNSQWVAGTNGTGSQFQIGWSNTGLGNTNWNPHNGIAGYLGITALHIDDSYRIGIGAEGDWGGLGSGNPLAMLHLKGRNLYTSYGAYRTCVIQNTQNGGGLNGSGLLVSNDRGNHSWGVVAEFRVDSTTDTDRSSISFTTAQYSGQSWSIGYAHNSGNDFRIKRDHGWVTSSWGTTLMQLDRNGNVTFTGNVTAYSDERLKKDIKTIDNALDLVKQMRGVTYKLKENDKEGVGVIAQEMEKVLPQVVLDAERDVDDEYEIKSVAYGNIVGVLIEAIKEQQAQIDELKSLLNK